MCETAARQIRASKSTAWSSINSADACGANAYRASLCYNPRLFSVISKKVKSLEFSRVFSFSKYLLVVLAAVSFGAVSISAQEEKVEKPAEKTDKKKEDPPKKKDAGPEQKNGKVQPNYTAEQIVESTIVIYAFPGGRAVLDQIRKTTFEKGKTSILNEQGKMDSANYQKWVIRGTALTKDKVRLDQEFPSVSYSLVQNGDKIFGIYNGSVFSPRDDASRSFENQMYRGLDGLLRYKEDESTLELAGKEKEMGVEYYLIDVTDKAGRKTRYYVSTKRFRVMMLDYEQDGKKYRRKFYDYNYAQGTLVPFRTVLYEGDKIVEETEIGTVTFGQKVDETLFPTS